jgi:hypothetical protein
MVWRGGWRSLPMLRRRRQPPLADIQCVRSCAAPRKSPMWRGAKDGFRPLGDPARYKSERRLTAAEDVHAPPTCDELVVRNGPHRLFPGAGLSSCEHRAFDPVCKVVRDETFIRTVVVLRTQRHLIKQPNDALTVERHAQHLRVVRGKREVGGNPVRSPVKPNQIAAARSEGHACVDGIVDRHLRNLPSARNVRNPPRADVGRVRNGAPPPRQISSCSDSSRASSTSMPRYLTVLSSLRWPSSSWQARRLPIFL